MQAGATGRHRPFPEKRAPFARLQVQARYQARPARRAVGHAHVGLRQCSSAKAEAAPHLRRAWSGSSSAISRRPPGSRARRGRTCCSCSNRGSTTSSTGWASARRAPEARQLVSHGSITVERQGTRTSRRPSCRGRRRHRDRPRRRKRSSASRMRCSSPRRSASRRGSKSTRRRCTGTFKGAPDRSEFAPGHQREPGRRVVFEIEHMRRRRLAAIARRVHFGFCH